MSGDVLNNFIDKMYMQDKDLMRSVWVRESSIKEIQITYNLDNIIRELEEKLSEKPYQHEYDDYYDGIIDAIKIVKKGGNND